MENNWYQSVAAAYYAEEPDYSEDDVQEMYENEMEEED